MIEIREKLVLCLFILLISTTSAFAYYNPEAGRFMQRDPLGIDPAGERTNRFRPGRQYTDGACLYQYVGNNPTNGRDPVGLFVMHPICCKFKQGVCDEYQQRLCSCGSGTQVSDSDCNCLLRARKVRQETIDDVESLNPPLPGWVNGPADAVRHCLTSCRLTQNLGALCARIAGDVHEWWHGDEQTPEEEAMDKHNNAVGRDCGGDCKTTCESCCMTKLFSGEIEVRPIDEWRD